MSKYLLIIFLSCGSLLLADRYSSDEDVYEELREIKNLVHELVEDAQVMVEDIHFLRRMAEGSVETEELPPFIRPEHLEPAPSTR